MTLSLILSVLGVCFFFAYLSFKIKEEHWPLTIITLFVSVYLLLFIPKFNEDTNTICQMEINTTNSTIEGSPNSTIIRYSYMPICLNFSQTNTGYADIQEDNTSFYANLTYIVWIFNIYLVIYLMKFMLEKLKGLIK